MNSNSRLNRTFCFAIAMLTAANFVCGSQSQLLAQSKMMSIPANGFVPEATTLVAACEKNWEDANAYIVSLKAAEKANQLDKVNLKSFGTSAASAAQLYRDSQRLRNFREPAGVDYEYRGDYCRNFLRDAAIKLKTAKRGSEYIAKAEKYKLSSADRRKKALQRVRKLFADGKLDQAEEEMEEILVDVDGFQLWLSPNSSMQIQKQINGVRALLMEPSEKRRESAAAAAFTEALKINDPGIDALLSSINTSISEIATSGNTTIDRKLVTGPQALKEFFLQWQVCQNKLIRCMSISILGNRMDVQVTPAQCIGAQLGTDDWAAAPFRLNAKMTELLPKFIAADLRRAKDEATAKDIYVRYLSTLGFMANKSANELMAACEKELAVLETRSGSLAKSIKNYKKATADMLLWRKRAAASAARSANSTDLNSAANILKDKSFSPNLLKGLDQIAADLQKTVGELNVYASNVQAINDNAGFASVDEQVWATVIGQFDLENEILELRNDLFISPDSPPLSPAAAISVLTAKRKSLTAAGGPISSVQIEAFGTRYSKLPTSMGSFVPLEKMPQTDGNLGKTLLRINLNPSWVQHEHFFKKL